VPDTRYTTTVAQKLGLAAGQTVLFLGAPDSLPAVLGELPDGVRVRERLGKGIDLLIFFTTSRARLEARIEALREAIRPDGMAWIAWPKRSSGVPSDVSDNVVRDVALPIGLVDTKVCAIDDTWSGLRLVIRKELR
jgi:hypothetical protein